MKYTLFILQSAITSVKMTVLSIFIAMFFAIGSSYAQPSISYSDVFVYGKTMPRGGYTPVFAYQNYVYLYQARAPTATQKPMSALLAMNERYEILPDNLLEPGDKLPARQFKEFVETEAGGWVLTTSFPTLRAGLGLYAQKLDPSGTQLGEVRELTHQEIGLTTKTTGYTVRVSEDKSRVLIAEHLSMLNTDWNKRSESDFLSLQVYDASMELLWEITPSFDDKQLLLSFMDFAVNNDGTAFALSYNDLGGMKLLGGSRKSDKFQLHQFGPAGRSEASELPLISSNFTDLKMEVLPTGNIFIAGMTDEKGQPGTFYYYFDPFDKEVLKYNSAPIEVKPLSRGTFSISEPLSNLAVKDIFVVDDKSHYIVAEAMYKNKDGFTVFADMLVIHFNSEVPRKVFYIPKNSGPRGGNKWYYATLNKENLHVFIKDNYVNMEPGRTSYISSTKNPDLIWFELSPDGNIRHSTLAEDAAIDIHFAQMREEREGKIWIFGSKLNKALFGQMILP